MGMTESNSAQIWGGRLKTEHKGLPFMGNKGKGLGVKQC